MTLRKRFLAPVAALCLATGLSSAAFAEPLTIDMGFEFSGAQSPASPTQPWLTATFTQSGSNVLLTLSAPNLVDQEFVTGWYFNFNPNLNLNKLSITQQGSATDPTGTASVGANAFKADGDGYFDILLAFPDGPPSARFGAGDTAQFLLKYNNSTLTPDAFNFLSVNGPVGKTGFLAAAKVQGIGPDAQGSGWIAPGPNTPPEVVPIPAAAWGGLVLLGGMAGARKLRRRDAGEI